MTKIWLKIWFRSKIYEHYRMFCVRISTGIYVLSFSPPHSLLSLFWSIYRIVFVITIFRFIGLCYTFSLIFSCQWSYYIPVFTYLLIFRILCFHCILCFISLFFLFSLYFCFIFVSSFSQKNYSFDVSFFRPWRECGYRHNCGTLWRVRWFVWCARKWGH